VAKTIKVIHLAIIILCITALVSSCSRTENATITPSPLSPFTGNITIPELPRDFPKDLRWLTDEEKTKITEIALNTNSAREWLTKESEYTTSISWLALNPNTEGEGYSGYQSFPYDTVEKGIPRGTVTVKYPDDQSVQYKGVPDNAEIYPCVSIYFGQEWIVIVAVDVNSGDVKYEARYPNLSNPNRFKTTPGS
jgi:hypothetical protein